MSSISNISRNKRRLVFFISIVVLLTAFFIGFYYNYVPSNKENVNKYAFLILDNIKTSVNRNTDNIKSQYESYVRQSGKSNCNVDSLLKNAGLEGRVSSPAITCNSQGLREPVSSTDSTSGILGGINMNQLVFVFHCGRQEINISVPLKNKLDPFFEMHRQELFNSFLLLKPCGDTGHMLYKDANLNMGENIIIDSLLPHNKGLSLPGTRDIQIEGLAYKMFYTPFTYDNQQFLLCGFVLENEYDAKLYTIPVSFIYPFVILFLLLVIALPIIKFYVMGPEEEIKFGDLILFVLSLFIGGTLITLVTIQVILLKDGDIRANANVQSLSAQIDNSFTTEVNKAYRQLTIFDSIIAKDFKSIAARDSLTKIRKNRYDVSDTIKNYVIAHKDDTSLYLGLDRVSWINSQGQQFMKGELRSNTFYTDVKDRNYFKVFADDNPYRLPNDHDSTFGTEAVYTLINGEFSTVISKRSLVPGAFIVSMATPMSSLTKTIQPEGYGFCIIDKEGNVQYHSDNNRNLLENFINQLESPTPVKEAIASRQEWSSAEADFYGKEYCIHVKPLANLPFYLITFYDKGYIVPVNMRILIFALLFCLISFVIYISIWFFVFRKSYYTNALLYSPMNYMHYIIPKRSHSYMYIKINLFLLLYIGMLISLTFLLKFSNINSNHVVLIIMLLTPVNIGAGITVLIYKFSPKKYRQAKLALGLLFVVSLIAVSWIYFASDQADLHFITFEAIFITALTVYYFKKPRLYSKVLTWAKEKYLFLHSLLGILLIMCLSVLPASLFTWYSHNQEIIQSVKKQQLFFAKELDQRRNVVQKSLIITDTFHGSKYYDQLLYKDGVYTIYSDTVSLINSKPPDITKSFDDFYFDISNEISNKYYDPQLFPALKDSSTDNTWSWYYPDLDSLALFFKVSPHSVSPVTGSNDNILEIKSKIPERYIFLKANAKGLLLILLCFGIFYGLYSLLRIITYKLALKKFLLFPHRLETPGIYKLIDEYKLIHLLEPSTEEKLRNLQGEYKTFLIPHETDKIMLQEKDMISLTGRYKGFYNFTWQKCSDEEKYLLYNFAREGLMNFKNTVEIYDLLNKGILVIMPEQEKVELFSKSFRAYILGSLSDTEINSLLKKFKQNSTWQSFRIPLLVILLVIASFIFFTQQNTWQKIMALIAGFSSTLPLLLNVFSRKTLSSSRSG